jgi:hypothetical protein
MADDRTEPFADVLRRARQAAQVTQTEQGYKEGIAADLAGLAEGASLLGQWERAAWLFGAAEAWARGPNNAAGAGPRHCPTQRDVAPLFSTQVPAAVWLQFGWGGERVPNASQE